MNFFKFFLILLSCLYSISSFGMWGIQGKKYGSYVSATCYLDGKEIFKDDNISDFTKPSEENQAWTFSLRARNSTVHINGTCIVFELKNSLVDKKTTAKSEEKPIEKTDDLIIDSKSLSEPAKLEDPKPASSNHGAIIVPQENKEEGK